MGAVHGSSARADAPSAPGSGGAYHTPVVESGTPAAGVTWTTGMDSVLQWSWQSGLDLQTVAEELGLNPKDLLLRAQMLATEGRLQPKAPAYDVSQSGLRPSARLHAVQLRPRQPGDPVQLVQIGKPLHLNRHRIAASGGPASSARAPLVSTAPTRPAPDCRTPPPGTVSSLRRQSCSDGDS